MDNKLFSFALKNANLKHYIKDFIFSVPIPKNVDLHGHTFKIHTSSYRCIGINHPAVSVSHGNNQNRIHKHRNTTLHNTALQLPYPEWSSDISARKSFWRYRKYPRR